MAELKRKVVKGVFWVLMERFSTQGVHFLVFVILSRLLTPTDYGTVALLGIFITIAKVFADSGFGGALVQKKNVSDLDFNSVFYFSLSATLLLYGVLFFIAPSVARFYNIPELCPIFRVISLTLIFNSINSVQDAELNRKMLFNRSFKISLIAAFASGLTGISMAFLGYGVWALVWATVVGGFFGVISRWFIIAWRPKLMFSWRSLKPLFSFGWKMSLASLLDTGFNNISGLVIGKLYSRADLSFVNNGGHMPMIIMSNINNTLGRVAFPTLSQMQNNLVKVRESMRRMMIVSTFLVFPLMVLFAITAKNTIVFLYGDQWLPAVPFAMIACFTFALWPFHTINLQGIQAIGRSDVFLKLEIVKKILALTVLVIFISKSVVAWYLAAAIVISPLAVIINSWPNRKLLNYTLTMQILDVLPSAFVCVISSIPILAMNFISVSSQSSRFLLLVGQGLVMFALFFGLAYLFKLRGFKELVMLAKEHTVGKMPRLCRIFEYLEG